MPHQSKIEFQDLATRHMCGQCDGVLTDPVQLPCGHLVCERCFVELFADKTEVICKIDKCGIGINKSEVFSDMCFRREIQNLKVYCTNKEHGCAEVIPWKMLQDHILTNCKYVQKNTPCGTELSNIQDEKHQMGDHGTYCEFLVRECPRNTNPVVHLGPGVDLFAEASPVHSNVLSTRQEASWKVNNSLLHWNMEDEDEEACDGTSIREDFERLSEIEKKTLEHVGDLKEQNKEVGDLIKAQAFKRLQKKITLTGVHLDELNDKIQHLLSENHDGVLIWKIRDYNRRRQEVGHGINSPPFYSSTYGYKMCGRIYLNGDGMGHGTHFSFYIVIMKGEYDALLSWPFQQDVTLMLLDQDTRTQNVSDTFKPDPESTSFSKPETDMNIASGISQFVEHSVLETPAYLQDDTIYLKIKVDVDNIPDLAATSDQGQVHDVEGVEEESH